MNRTIYPNNHAYLSLDKLLSICKPFGNQAGNLLMLYVFYYSVCHRQKTNQIYCTNPFVHKALHWHDKKIRKYRRILRKLGLIESVVKRDNLHRISKHYIKVKNILPTIPYSPVSTRGVIHPSNALIVNKYGRSRRSTNDSSSQSFSLSEFLSYFPQDWTRRKSFKTLVADYYQHRKQKRKPLTKISAKRLANKLSNCGSISVAGAALSTSIENGWTGVFPKGNGNGNGHTAVDMKDSPKVILMKYMKSHSHEWVNKCLKLAIEVLEPKSKSEKQQIAMNLIDFYEHISSKQSRPTFNKPPKSSSPYYNSYRVWEMIPDAVGVVVKYANWLNEQDWINGKSIKLFHPEHKMFDRFVSEWQRNEGYNLYTGATYRG